MTSSDKQKISLYMEKLGLSEAEARQLLHDDREIDKGKNLFPLSSEGEKVAKSVRNSAGKAPTGGKSGRKKKPPDFDKKFIIDKLIDSINQFATIENVTNPEREVTFTYRNVLYRLTLAKPRTGGK